MVATPMNPDLYGELISHMFRIYGPFILGFLIVLYFVIYFAVSRAIKNNLKKLEKFEKNFKSEE